MFSVLCFILSLLIAAFLVALPIGPTIDVIVLGRLLLLTLLLQPLVKGRCLVFVRWLLEIVKDREVE